MGEREEKNILSVDVSRAADVRLTSADTLAKASAGAVVGGRAGHVSGGVERRRPASRSVDHVDRRAGVSTSLLRSAL